MHRPTWIVALAAVAAAAACPRAVAGETWSWCVGVDAASGYTWRGMPLHDAPVVQPGITLTGHGVSLGAWASLDATGPRASKAGWAAHLRLEEVDLTAGYSRTVGRVTLGGGLALYTFPGSADPNEVEANGSIAVELPVTLTASAARGLSAGGGTYVSLAASHGFRLGERTSLDACASVGWADASYSKTNFGVSRSSAADLGVGLTLDRAVSRAMTVSPFFRFARFLPGPGGDALGRPSGVVAGVSLAFKR